MVGTSVFLSTLAISFASYVVAVPINNSSPPSTLSSRSPSIQKRAFSVTQTQNIAEQFDGAWALKKAYLKHGIPLPDHLVKRQAPIQPPQAIGVTGGLTSDVPAISVANDLEYVSPVEVGGTTMRLDF